MKATTLKPVNINNEHLNNLDSFVERENSEYYLSNIRVYSPLERQEEIALVKEAKTSEIAFNKFVNHNLLLVYKIAKHYMHVGLPLEDLIQYGNIGLIESARAYVEHKDYYLKNRFNTYAVWYIRKEIVDAIETEGKIVRRSHNIEVLSLKLQKIINTFEVEHGRKPDLVELSEITNESIKNIKEALNNSIMSIDTPVDDDDESAGAQSYSDTLVGHQTADGDLMKDDMRKRLNMMMKILDKREAEILRMLFGIGYDYEYPIDRIAEEYKTTAENIRIIKNKALKKLKLNFKQC